MSHFTVLVVGENIEEQLKPFQENNMGDCPNDYLEFHDSEDEYRERYEIESTDMIRLADGTLKCSCDEEFKLPCNKDVLAEQKYQYPEGAQEVKVPFKERYATFEDFMKDYAGYKARDKTKGRYGYWENPNAKWDWYRMGGRWTGFFKLKSGRSGEVGDPGILTDRAGPGYADSALKSDIDFEGMVTETENEGRKRYQIFAKLMGGSIPAINPLGRASRSTQGS